MTKRPWALLLEKAEAVTTIDQYHLKLQAMGTARLFRSGRSQAVRLPKDYRFLGSEVAVQHFGHGVLNCRSTIPG